MSSSTSNYQVLTFGVEMELLVKPKPALNQLLKEGNFNHAVQPNHQDDAAKEANRRALRLALANVLTDAGVETKLEVAKYASWTVIKEASLTEVTDARGGGYWAIELVSPVLSTQAFDWPKQFQIIFEALDMSCDILLSTGCSMHVHVGLGVNEHWPLAPRVRLVKAIAVFDEAIMRIMPADRKMNPWARSRFRDIDTNDPAVKPSSAEPDLKKAFDEVPTKSWKPLFDIFDAIKMKQMVFRKLGQARHVSMNFANVDNEKCNTVEFRRPPGVKTATDAQKWAAFTVAFVRAAIEPHWYDQWVSSRHHASVQDLQKFVKGGLNLLGSGWGNLLDPRQLVEDTSPPLRFEAFKLEEVKRKLAKAVKESPFEEKVMRSRENSPSSSQPGSPARTSSPAGTNSPVRSSSPARLNIPVRPRTPANPRSIANTRPSTPVNRRPGAGNSGS
ncbi:hypothetical protein VTK56DRAFT_1676 [Thermocarpiscus australiensis]